MDQHGVPFLNEDNTKTYLDTPEAIEAVKAYYKIMTEYHAAPTLGQARELGNIEMFYIGRIATMYGHSNTAFDFKEKIKTFDWDIAPLPRCKKRLTTNFQTYWCISNKTKYPSECWEVIKYLTGAEGQKLRYDITKDMPVLIELAKELYLNPEDKPRNSRFFIEALNYSSLFQPKIDINSQIGKILGDEMGNALHGVKGYTIEEACKNAAKGINRLLEEHKRDK